MAAFFVAILRWGNRTKGVLGDFPEVLHWLAVLVGCRPREALLPSLHAQLQGHTAFPVNTHLEEWSATWQDRSPLGLWEGSQRELLPYLYHLNFYL